MIKAVFFVLVAYGLFCWFEQPNVLSNNILLERLVPEYMSE